MFDWLFDNNGEHMTTAMICAYAAVGVIFCVCLAIAIYIKCFYPPSDYFVYRALNYLIISLFIRIVMTTKQVMNAKNQAMESITLQQIFYEVPFYFFLIVPLSMLYSLKLAYINIHNFIEGRDENEVNSSQNRDESVESLDHNLYDNSQVNPNQTLNEPLLTKIVT